MKILDKMFNYGSSFRLLLFIASVIILSIYIVRYPGQNRGTWIFLFLGCLGTLREFRMWISNRRSQHEHTADS